MARFYWDSVLDTTTVDSVARWGSVSTMSEALVIPQLLKCGQLMVLNQVPRITLNWRELPCPKPCHFLRQSLSTDQLNRGFLALWKCGVAIESFHKLKWHKANNSTLDTSCTKQMHKNKLRWSTDAPRHSSNGWCDAEMLSVVLGEGLDGAACSLGRCALSL